MILQVRLLGQSYVLLCFTVVLVLLHACTENVQDSPMRGIQVDR